MFATKYNTKYTSFINNNNNNTNGNNAGIKPHMKGQYRDIGICIILHYNMY